MSVLTEKEKSELIQNLITRLDTHYKDAAAYFTSLSDSDKESVLALYIKSNYDLKPVIEKLQKGGRRRARRTRRRSKKTRQSKVRSRK